jgi:hypothetical protein
MADHSFVVEAGQYYDTAKNLQRQCIVAEQRKLRRSTLE